MDKIKEKLYQMEVREYIEHNMDNCLMVPVYASEVDDYDIFYQSYLIPKDLIEEVLKKDTIDYENLMPGFTQYGFEDDDEIIYSRFNNSDNAEPLVIKRMFSGLADDTVEILEEFRLLNNLYYNSKSNTYDNLENSDVVISIKDKTNVYIHRHYLKRFLAVKNMVLVLSIDSRYEIKGNDKIPNDNISYRTNKLYYNLSISNYERKTYSLLMGKMIIEGTKREECGYWPYDKDKDYEKFIIGIDSNGNELSYTSNPDKLGNYFGANPGAPHYLTPVYFEKDVLNKYYSKPEIYSIEDGIIRCGSLWSIYIDNQNKDYVSVYLGDLGRDLPSKREQLYWKSFNKYIDGKLSKTKYSRDFMAQFEDPEAIDLLFKQKFVNFNQRFKEKYHWQFFLELDEKDKYNFEQLRIPVNESIAEMDMLTLSLVKVMIDSLNEKEIVKQIKGDYEKLPGSINKLELWLKELNNDECSTHIIFLRNLQNLRSSGTGHRKGDNYKKISKVFDMDAKKYKDVFEDILKQCNSFIDYLCNILLQ